MTPKPDPETVTDVVGGPISGLTLIEACAEEAVVDWVVKTMSDVHRTNAASEDRGAFIGRIGVVSPC
jgi:hypothetical protein